MDGGIPPDLYLPAQSTHPANIEGAFERDDQ
jgi:hypothetical protein